MSENIYTTKNTPKHSLPTVEEWIKNKEKLADEIITKADIAEYRLGVKARRIPAAYYNGDIARVFRMKRLALRNTITHTKIKRSFIPIVARIHRQEGRLQ